MALIVLSGFSLCYLLAPEIAFAQDEDGDKSGVSPQVISLPSGPGSLEGLGESFEPQLSTGMASYPVHFLVPPGVNRFQPHLGLNYNGGFGNGPWGLGWSLNVPSIQRRTDAGLPLYQDLEDQFIYNGEKLVPVGDGYYRLENEGLFIRFRLLPSGGWEAHQPNGVRMIFGDTRDARVENGLGIFRWELQQQFDTQGNEIRYSYFHDNGFTYIDEVHYNFSSDGRHNTVKFLYEERPDHFTDRTSRFPITTSLRGTEIQIFALDQFVRSYQIRYTAEGSTGRHSLLASVTQVGNDGLSTLPATTFAYTESNPESNRVVQMQNPPPKSAFSPHIDLVDITYDGLPDLLDTTTQPQRFYMNRGDGVWDPNPVFVNQAPVEKLGSPAVRIADMDGNGQVDFVVKAGTTSTAPFYYYAAQPGELWQASDRVDYNLTPFFDLNDPNLQLVDMNNDKRIDVLFSAGDQYLIWLAHQDNHWSSSADYVVPAPAVGSPLTFDNPRVRLADMTGDRLQDIVFVRDGYIVYFPHNGFGDYDAPVVMSNVPADLGNDDLEIKLGDLNNDGLDDIVLPTNRVVRYWLNLGDNSFGDMEVILNTPELVPNETAVRLVDIDGDGGIELLFNRYPANEAEVMQYVDFSIESQPNLLHRIDNGLGRQYLIDYQPSTTYYREDMVAGNPWTTKVPFPLQLVKRVTISDANSGDQYITEYRYRDGYYDGQQKEFRGFAEVVSTSYGDETVPTTVIKSLFDTGVDDESRKGQTLKRTIMGEGGDCIAPVNECFQELTNQIETRSLLDGVSFSFVAQTDTAIYENTDEPIFLRQAFDYDQYGNVIEHFNYGQICGNDVRCGEDERLAYYTYAENVDDWLINFSSRQWQTDIDGNFVSERRIYYDGEPFVGLPLGQVETGNMTRLSAGLGPHDGNRFIDTQRNEFDDFGNVVAILDGNANKTRISYDNLVHTFPLAEYIYLDDKPTLSIAATYDFGFGQIRSMTDFNGNASHYEYDEFGRIHKIALSGDTLNLPTQEFVYTLGTPRSSILTIERERSGEEAVRKSIVYMDGLGRTLQTRREAEDGLFSVENATTFNARQAEYQNFLPYFDDTFDYETPHDGLPHATKRYDAQNRYVEIVNPDHSVTSIKYLPLKQIHFDEEDNFEDSPHFGTPKTLYYDGLERLIGVDEWNRTNGNDELYSTRYEYDLLDNVIKFVDAQDNLKTMVYDGLSRKLFMDDPDRGEVTYVYDDFGNVVQTTDGKDQTIVYEYDAVNRLLAEKWSQPDGSLYSYAKFQYDYDLSARHPEAQNTLGQVTYIEDEAGYVFLSYDARGNTIGESRYFADEDLEFITLMGYDATDRLSTLVYPDGRSIQYLYNEQGLLEEISHFVDDIDYIASGQQDSMRYTNGIGKEYDYDSRLRINRLRYSTNEKVFQDLAFVFDHNSNIVNITDNRPSLDPELDQTQLFHYDALYRLISASGSYGEINYAYDAIGNMVEKSSDVFDSDIDIGEMRYGENGAGPHALTSVGTSQIYYDSNGSLISYDRQELLWDYQNQLVNLTDAEADISESYVYDFAGNRVLKSSQAGLEAPVSKSFYVNDYVEIRDGIFISYVFVGANRVAQIEQSLDSLDLLKSFTPDPLFNSEKGEKYWYVSDHLGGTNSLINESGEAVHEILYYPFGSTRYERTNHDTVYKFTDKELDQSGLYYFETRYLSSHWGRFISIDPLISEHPSDFLKNPQSLNTYAYVQNNPLRFVDPNGTDGTESEVTYSVEKLGFRGDTYAGVKKDVGDGVKIGVGASASIGASASAKYADSSGLTSAEVTLSATVVGVSADAGYRDQSIGFEIGYQTKTIEGCVETCALFVCVSACASVGGPQMSVEARIGAKNKLKVRAGVVGAGVEVRYSQSGFDRTVEKVKQAVNSTLREGYARIMSPLKNINRY